MGSVARRCSATRRERPRPANGGAMATSGSHRAQPFGGRGRCERRRTETRSLGALQEAVARATPRVAGVPLMGGTHRPQGRSMNITKAPAIWSGLSLSETDDCFFFQVTSWHRRKSTYIQWSRFRPKPHLPEPVRRRHRKPLPVRHKPLARYETLRDKNHSYHH